MPTNTSGMNAETEIQAQIAGDDVALSFSLKGEEKVFHQEVFKQGVTFEWVKNKVALALEAKYNDLSLYFNDKRIPEPFSIVDLPYVVSGSIIAVEIAEGAEVGLDKLRQ